MEEILLAILNGTTIEAEAQSEIEAILLNITNKSIYEEVPTSRIAELLILWSKQEADPERFKFPFRINQGEPVEMSIVSEG
jgi:hypothetical protein